MSNEHKTTKSAYAAAKLSDTQRVLLSAAAQGDDHCLAAPPNLKGGAAQKVAQKLIAAGLVREIKAKTGAPVWRRDEETAKPFALKLTRAGLKAIAVDDGATDEEAAEPTGGRAETYRNTARRVADRARARSHEGEASEGPSRQFRAERTPSAPRPGSKGATIVDLLQRAQGATMEELIAATGWLPHTTRAALTGLKKRGYEIARSRLDGLTRYRIACVDPALNGPGDREDPARALRSEKAA